MLSENIETMGLSHRVFGGFIEELSLRTVYGRTVIENSFFLFDSVHLQKYCSCEFVNISRKYDLRAILTPDNEQRQGYSRLELNAVQRLTNILTTRAAL